MIHRKQIIPVLASSISPYEPAEPPPEPECTAADLADTRKNLEWLLKLQLEHGISSIGDLRACALTMSDLADVIELQDKTSAGWPKIRQYVSGHFPEDDTIDPDYAEDVR